MEEKERPVTDAKEVGVGNPAEEKTFCHRTLVVYQKWPPPTRNLLMKMEKS
jgi:hypothetical protein